jgi:hypothetical protein
LSLPDHAAARVGAEISRMTWVPELTCRFAFDQYGGQWWFVAFSTSGRIGLHSIGVPIRCCWMMAERCAHRYSARRRCGVFAHGARRHQTREPTMSDETLSRFPGSYSAPGVEATFEARRLLGTILKPAQESPTEEERLVEQAAGSPMFLFVRKMRTMPRVPFAPWRSGCVNLDAVRRAADRRGGRDSSSRPDTAPPHLLVGRSSARLGGANSVMFSEYYTGGSVRAFGNGLH